MMDDGYEDRQALIHQNQPYDESLEVPDDEEIASTYSPTPRVPNPSVKAHEALRLNRQDLSPSRGNSPPHSAMSDPSDDQSEEKSPVQPVKRESSVKKAPSRRQALLSARSQKKATNLESECREHAVAHSSQMVNLMTQDSQRSTLLKASQDNNSALSSGSLPQLGPRPPQQTRQGVLPGGSREGQQGMLPSESREGQKPTGLQVIPQRMGQHVPQAPHAPMMPRITSQQLPQMSAPQMTLQEAAMRARAQAHCGQLQMAQMAQMTYLQHMQMMQMTQMGYGMQRRPQSSESTGSEAGDEGNDSEDEDYTDDEEDDDEDDDDDMDEIEEQEKEPSKMAVIMETFAQGTIGNKDNIHLPQDKRQLSAQTIPRPSKEEKANGKKIETKQVEKEETLAKENVTDLVTMSKKEKKSRKCKSSSKQKIPSVRARGVLRDLADLEQGVSVSKSFGTPRDVLPDIAGVKKPPPKPAPIGRSAAPQSQQFNSEDEEDDDDSDDDDDPQVEGAYDPAEFENLSVSAEIKELFQYITRYTPQSIELDHKLKPFIPDFIPSVGDIDAFIKIPRPDNKPDTLGLTVLDEPCAKQSDPTVLDLQLRAISKQTTAKTLSAMFTKLMRQPRQLGNRGSLLYIKDLQIVKSLENAEKNPKAIENWIESIRDLHRSKPPPNVHYSRNMPDIDTLMQEWPPEFEELLKKVSLPTADLDCDLGQFIEIICSILDIPIYKNSSHHNEKIQALHVLFTLYSEFKNSQHFQALAANN